jgi:hypothetical protein
VALRNLGRPDRWARSSGAGPVERRRPGRSADQLLDAGAVPHQLPVPLRQRVRSTRGGSPTVALVERAQRAGVPRPDVDLTDIGLLVWASVRATEGLRTVRRAMAFD